VAQSDALKPRGGALGLHAPYAPRARPARMGEAAVSYREGCSQVVSFRDRLAWAGHRVSPVDDERSGA
jgi:hypothetical protein